MKFRAWVSEKKNQYGKLSEIAANDCSSQLARRTPLTFSATVGAVQIYCQQQGQAATHTQTHTHKLDL